MIATTKIEITGAEASPKALGGHSSDLALDPKAAITTTKMKMTEAETGLSLDPIRIPLRCHRPHQAFIPKATTTMRVASLDLVRVVDLLAEMAAGERIVPSKVLRVQRGERAPKVKAASAAGGPVRTHRPDSLLKTHLLIPRSRLLQET
jgi:hypothetical protein